MNSFEGSLYSLLDSFISSDVGLIIFLLGGFEKLGVKPDLLTNKTM